MQRAGWLPRDVLTEMAQIKVWIVANSRVIGKIYNVDMGSFRCKAAHHELIRNLRYDQMSSRSESAICTISGRDFTPSFCLIAAR